MTNSDNGVILEEIANSVATVYKWKDYYLPEIKKVVDVDTSVLTKYLGKYNLNGTTMTIKKSHKDLVINVYGDVLWKLNFTSDSDFFIREYRGFLRFQTGNNNNVTGFNFNGMTVKKIE